MLFLNLTVATTVFVTLLGIEPRLASSEPAPKERSVQGTIEARAGTSMSTIVGSATDSSSIDYGYKPALIVGILGGLSYSPGKRFLLNLETGLGVVQKGYRSERVATGERNELSLLYANLPIRVRGSWLFTGWFRSLYLAVGVDFGRLLDAKLSGADVDRLISSYEVAYLAGIGASGLPLWGGEVTLEVDFSRGLSNLRKDPSEGPESRSQSFYLTIGYRTDISTLMRRLTGGESGAPKATSGR